MLGRRAFLIGCGWVATAPALANAWSLLAPSSPRQVSLGDSLLQQALAGETQPAGTVLRIDGWERPFDHESSADGEVWISINQSWRSAWR
jgi:hypothetical protein